MSLFSALSSTANALSAFEQALSVTQNNVNNASTAGYARQVPVLQALPFEQGTGEVGGVQSGPMQDTRNLFAEANVQTGNSQLGLFQQQASSLTSLQNNFDISGTTGIPAALSSLYSAFSTWSSSPGSATNQNAVLSAAQSVATSFQQTASQVSQLGTSTDTTITADLATVNALAAQLSGYNAQIESGNGHDPGLQAAIYDTLQQLSQYVNVSSIAESNGTVTVMLGSGQTPLVSGATAQTLSVSVYIPQPPPPTYPSGPPTAHVHDAQGNEITSELSGGKLGALLKLRNTTLPAIQGDGTQQGSLNQLAQSFADRVNGLLTAGTVSAGPPPVTGTALFSYDASNATNAAASLQVATGVTGSQLAASDGTTSNGNALKLANLANSTNAADQISGQTYTQFYGSIAASVGQQLADAKNGSLQAQDTVTQAVALRQQVSGVDLNQEAAQVLQFQQAYQAASKVISVIDSMTQTVLGLIGSGTAA